MSLLVLPLLAACGFAFFCTSFETKVITYVVALPLVTWCDIHFSSKAWSAIPTAILVLATLQAIGLRPTTERIRPATGLTAVVFAYGGLAAIQAFNPLLPSTTLGLRGARLIVEPLLLYFVGIEVARRPALLRRLVITILAVGALVALYALRQSIVGFDAEESRFYRQNFAISFRESRVAGTMAGATVLGHHVALVAFLAIGVMANRALRTWLLTPLAVLCGFVALLTGQRGVLVSGAVALPVVLAIGILRWESRTRMARVGRAAAIAVALIVALAVSTPVQDRRLARAEGTSAYEAAKIKLAQLKSGGDETSLQLRVDRMQQLVDATHEVPLGAGSGLNLLVDTAGVSRRSILGDAGLGATGYRPPVPPIPGELYWYTVASELGVVGLALYLALGLFAVVTAAGVAIRTAYPMRAAVATAAAGYLVFTLVDGASADAMTSQQVASYFWLLVGVVGAWAQSDRTTEPVVA